MVGMLAPLLQIIPELTELRGEPSVVVVVSTRPSSPPSEPCQTLAHVDSGGLDASATLLSVDICVVSFRVQIAEIGVLAPNYEAPFAKKLSDLLVSIEAASPRYGMVIALSPGRFRDCLIDVPHSSWRVRLVGLLCGVVLFVSLVCGCSRLRELVGRCFRCCLWCRCIDFYPIFTGPFSSLDFLFWS
jgi:hypothetical protein